MEYPVVKSKDKWNAIDGRDHKKTNVSDLRFNFVNCGPGSMKQYTNISEQFLLQQIIAGKEEAFDFIFRKYFKALCAQAVLFVKDRGIAQNIVQDSFIRFWEKRAELEEVRNLSAFLTFMVRNRAIDYVRKEKTQRAHVDRFHYQHQNDTTDNLAISYEFEEIMMEAILKLPDRCREAFEYSRFEGLTYVQIAEKMGITPKAVEALMGRSLKILRSELMDYLPVLCILLYRY